MIRDFRIQQFGALFSDGVEIEAPASAAERRQRRAELLRESAGRKFARFCADINHSLKPRSLLGLPSTLDFLLREKSIGVAGLPDARNVRLVPDGLAGVAADLAPESVVDAYSRGLFLRWMLGQPTYWAPQDRMIAKPEALRKNEDIAALLASGGYRFTLDREFDAVVNAVTADAVRLRAPYAPSEKGMSVFAALHDSGFAHSVEIRCASGELAAGLYGIACGRSFVIQGRFGATPALADLAVAILNRHLLDWSFELVDGCADHSLARLGFQAAMRDEYLALLPQSLSGGQPGRWIVNPELLLTLPKS